MAVVIKVKKRDASAHRLRQKPLAVRTVNMNKVESGGLGDVCKDEVRCTHGVSFDATWSERFALFYRLRCGLLESLS